MSLDKYKIISTADGSPSLVLNSTDEAMHNKMGALSESLAIYYSAMEECYRNFRSLSVLSVGLGIGYNELLFAAFCLQYNYRGQIRSFEAQDFLRDSWNNWRSGEDSNLNEIYETIVKQVSAHFELEEGQLHESVKHCLCEGELSESTEFPNAYNCIVYDPYSANSNPEMWSNESLIKFICEKAQDNCLFTTYAAKGSLTRQLKSLGFDVELKEGFGGKRNRTWAIRR